MWHLRLLVMANEPKLQGSILTKDHFERKFFFTEVVKKLYDINEDVIKKQMGSWIRTRKDNIKRNRIATAALAGAGAK